MKESLYNFFIKAYKYNKTDLDNIVEPYLIAAITECLTSAIFGKNNDGKSDQIDLINDMVSYISKTFDITNQSKLSAIVNSVEDKIDKLQRLTESVGGKRKQIHKKYRTKKHNNKKNKYIKTRIIYKRKDKNKSKVNKKSKVKRKIKVKSKKK